MTSPRKARALGRALILSLLSSSILAGPVAGDSRLEGDLARAADLGFGVTEERAALVVYRTDAHSPAAQAGLRDGDVIVAVNGETFERPYVGADLLRRLDGGREARLAIEQDGRRLELAFEPPPRPLETLEGVDIVYGVVEAADGSRLRTIVTRPSQLPPLGAIFFVQWVSCDTVELSGGGPMADILAGLASRSQMALMRVERTASGDSEGPGCHQLDYDTEIAHYRLALEHLIRSRGLDPSRVVVVGDSLGSTVAPLVAQGLDLAGLVVSGGGALTYVERMINFDRIAFERLGTDPRQIDGLMREHIEFHVEYLLRGKTPEQITRERPELADVWGRMRGTGEGVHYGRPYAYHQQAAARDLLGAWARIEAPVLVLFGEYDQFELAHGHRTIVETVNRERPGTARFVLLPQVGHGFRVYPTPELAASWSRGQPVPELVLEPILAWLRHELGFVPEPAPIASGAN